MESYSVNDAARHALTWCSQNAGWQRICDIENVDALYKQWDELPQKTRASWTKHHPDAPEDAWREFGESTCKVPYGFISGKGVFYKDILDVPHLHNSMMVFKTH